MKFPYQTVSAITGDITPGFYRIDHNAYHHGPGISSSAVKKALVSYDQFMAPHENSTALTFGRAFHASILEPDLFDKMPRIAGGSRTKAYQSHVEAGNDVVCDDDLAVIEGMTTAIKAHPEYANMGTPDPEIMAITRCQDTGLLIKCKADLFGSAIIDFKSTSGGVTPAEFMHAVCNFGYHVSAAFYHDIISSLTGVKTPFIWVPATKSAPYECEFYEADEAMLEEGRKLYKAGLRRIKRWLEQDGEARIKAEKKIRRLTPGARLLYSTKDTLEFLEPS